MVFLGRSGEGFDLCRNVEVVWLGGIELEIGGEGRGV